MGILDALLGIGSLASTGYGFYRQGQNNQLIEGYDNPGGVGRVGYDHPFDVSRLAVGPNAGSIEQQLRDVAARVTGGGLAVQQATADQQALDAQKPYYDSILSTVQNGTLGKADQFAQELLKNPQAISQDTLNRMAASLYDQNAAATQTNLRTAQDQAAASGAGPGAVLAANQQSQIENQRANDAGLRDLLVQQAIANANYKLQAGQLAGALGGQYADAFANASQARAGLEQAPDYAGLGALLNQDELQKLGLQLGQNQTDANSLFTLGGGLLQYAAQRQQAQAIRDASNRGGLFSPGNPFGSLIQAPLSGLGLGLSYGAGNAALGGLNALGAGLYNPFAAR